MAGTGPRLSTAPVLAVLVCHDGAQWLPQVLASLRDLSVRPRHVLAVDTGSSDQTPELLADAAGSGPQSVLDGVLTLDAETGFGAAVSAAMEHAVQRWGDPGKWLWLLHDDAAPEADCLDSLLNLADMDSSAAALGPLGLDWQDPRLVVDRGLSLDAAGHVQTGMTASELDPALQPDSVAEHSPASALQVSEVLAVSSACLLVRRDVFEQLGGFDSAMPIGCDDVDFGWRVNAAGHLVLCVPGARMRHAAAWRQGEREASAVVDRWPRTPRSAQRRHGVRTFLVNTGVVSFVLGVPRLFLLSLLRMVGFLLLRRSQDAAAEAATAWSLFAGRLSLLRARGQRRRTLGTRAGVRGLLTSRVTRLRNGVRAAFARFVRERVRRDVLLGRTPSAEPVGSDVDDIGAIADSTAAAKELAPAGRASLPVGPTALPAGALGGANRSRTAGLRRPSAPVVVPVGAAGSAAHELRFKPRPAPRPSPVPRNARSHADDLLVVPVNRARVFKELVLTPPVVLAVTLVLFALLTHGLLADHPRFGPGLHGGRLLPVTGIGQVWADYIAAWHHPHGGTGSPAPASLLVLGLLGAVLFPIGGTQAAVALLMLFGVPLAGMAAYAATRSVPVPRWWRAVIAGAYALLPFAVSAAAHGRVGVVVAHILIPPVLAGIASVTGLSPVTAVRHRTGSSFRTACVTAIGLALLGAFAPLMHVVMLLLALLAFVAVPARGRAPRRLAGLVAMVLLSVACLLPWPVVLLRHPEILIHGLGARTVEAEVSASMVALNPASSLVGWASVLVVVAALVALMLAPSRALVPGIVVALVGWATAAVVGTVSVTPVWGGAPSVGFTAAPLVLTACGLLWMVLAAARHALPSWREWSLRSSRMVAVGLAVSLLGLATAAAFAGSSGPLRTRSGTATPALLARLAEPGYLLSIDRDAQPPRFTAGRRAYFGTDALVPAPTAIEWLEQVESKLLSGSYPRVREGIAAAAARGVSFIAVPDAATAESLRTLAGDFLEDGGRLADGRVVLRIRIPNSPVELLGPALARKARRDGAPQPQVRPVPVEQASLPHVAVRVSAGGPGRLLVLAAENEPGWRAWVNGEPAPLATAWGHQVAVPLPQEASKVRVTFNQVPRTSMLAVQAAAILFTLIGALPTRRREE